MSKRKRPFVLLAITVTILILELLPYGAVLEFAHMSPDLTLGYYEQHFSYFDPIVYGYGHIGPLITAVSTCILAVFAVVAVFLEGRAVRIALRVASLLTLLFSLTPMLTGCYSPVGMAISVLLLVTCIISLKKEETI
ncbi:MAG: hypothetical protein IJD38_08660 [Clostridia bacterium]|nr:hypothetical protein [Clostridia bacterium]